MKNDQSDFDLLEQLTDAMQAYLEGEHADTSLVQMCLYRMKQRRLVFTSLRVTVKRKEVLSDEKNP